MKPVKSFILLIFALLAACSEFKTLKVVSCYPGDRQYGVQPDELIYIEFNNNVNQSDIVRLFYAATDAGELEGRINWLSGKAFNYIPLNGMETGARYVISIPRTVRDTDGNRMEQDFISEFYVGEDMEKPFVISTYPAYSEGGTRNVPDNAGYLSFIFSEPMDRLKSEASFSISPYVSGYFSWNADSTEMRYVLTAEMDYGSQYKMSVSQTAEDMSGNTLEIPYSVIFITGSDFELPYVNGIYNAGMIPATYWDTGNTNELVSKFVDIAVQFSESMKRTETESAFSITPPVDGTFEWNADSTIMTFSPKEPLKSETLYSIRIDTSAKDMNGWKLRQDCQAAILTNNNDSLYIRVGDVSGTNNIDSVPYAVLFNETPAQWPVPLEMGPYPAPIPDDNPNNYHFRIQFINDNGIIAFSPYTIFDNLLYEGFGADHDPGLANISWNAGHTELYIELDNLSNDAEVPAYEPVLYRLTIVGGENGVKDMYGNTMLRNFSFELRE